MYYLRLLMTEVAWTKDELREALDGETLLFVRSKPGWGPNRVNLYTE